MDKFNKKNEKFENSSDFESFNFNTLENQAEHISSERKVEIEHSRELEAHDNREALLAMYETHEARDRDVSSFEANEIGKALNNENIYLNDYQATFATYSDRDGFDLRSNNNSSQEFLDESIKLTKSEKNTTTFSGKTSNVAKALAITLGLSKIS